MAGNNDGILSHLDKSLALFSFAPMITKLLHETVKVVFFLGMEKLIKVPPDLLPNAFIADLQ